MSLDRILAAAERFGAPSESIGVLIAKAEGRHAVRVVVGREVVVHIGDARTRDEALTRALDELEDAARNVADLKASIAFVEATSW